MANPAVREIRILDFSVRSKCGIDRRCLLCFLDGGSQQTCCDSPAHLLPDQDWCLQSYGKDNQRRLGAKRIYPTYNNPHIIQSRHGWYRLGISMITSVTSRTKDKIVVFSSLRANPLPKFGHTSGIRKRSLEEIYRFISSERS